MSTTGGTYLIVRSPLNSVRGSVITPVIAPAIAVTGLTRCTAALSVPERPSKLRLAVDSITPLLGGEKPCPIHAEQAADACQVLVVGVGAAADEHGIDRRSGMLGDWLHRLQARIQRNGRLQ